jgi:hypothetical protein
MPRRRAVSLALALSAALVLPSAAPAQGVFVAAPEVRADRAGLTGQRAHVARELPRFGFRGVDVTRLSNLQVARLNLAIHGDGSHGEVRGRINGILRRGFLQRGLDGLSR